MAVPIPDGQLRRYLQLLTFEAYSRNAPDFPPQGLLTPALLDPNYEPPNRAPVIIAVSCCLCSITIFVVGLRLWVMQTWAGLSLGWEDYTIIPAAILLIAQSSIQIFLTTAGLGLHGYDAAHNDFDVQYRLYQPVVQLYFYNMFFAKLSNLFFVWRITPLRLKRARWLIVAFFVFNTVWTLVSSLVNLFACSPISANWDFWVHLQGRCMNMYSLAVITNSIYAASDFAFLALPLYIVSHMQLPPRTKLGIACLFSLGIAATAACTVKVVFWAKYYRTYDQMWAAVDVLKWAEAECAITVILVSLPTLDVVLVKMLPRRWRDHLRQRDEQMEQTLSGPVRERCVSPAKLEFAKQLDPRFRPDDLLSTDDTGESCEAYEPYSAIILTSTTKKS